VGAHNWMSYVRTEIVENSHNSIILNLVGYDIPCSEFLTSLILVPIPDLSFFDGFPCREPALNITLESATEIQFSQ
jgi:hypothetical protein